MTAGDGTAPPRRDRASRVVVVAILVALIVPVVWLVVTAAIQGPDAVDRTPPPTTAAVPQ